MHNESAAASADQGFLSMIDATSLFGFSTEYLNVLCMSPWFWPLHVAASTNEPHNETLQQTSERVPSRGNLFSSPVEHWSLPLCKCLEIVGLYKESQPISDNCGRLVGRLERICEIHSSTNEQMMSDRQKEKKNGILTATRQVQQNLVTELLEENLSGRAWVAIAGQLEKV